MKVFTRTEVSTRQVIRVERVIAEDPIDAMRRLDAGEGSFVSETCGPVLTNESSECVETPEDQCVNGKTGVTVVLEGGMISAVVSDNPRAIGCTIRIVDYDTEDTTDPTTAVIQADGKEVEACVWDVVIERSLIEVQD